MYIIMTKYEKGLFQTKWFIMAYTISTSMSCGLYSCNVQQVAWGTLWWNTYRSTQYKTGLVLSHSIHTITSGQIRGTKNWTLWRDILRKGPHQSFYLSKTRFILSASPIIFLLYICQYLYLAVCQLCHHIVHCVQKARRWFYIKVEQNMIKSEDQRQLKEHV